jgi:hypothetical protein
VTDDPLSGDSEQPPIVPMNDAEVVEFDELRAIMRMSPRRRRLVLGGILAASLLVLLVEIYPTSSRSSNASALRAAEHRSLVSDCSRLRADEKAYANGTLTQEFFDRDLLAMMYTPVNPTPIPARLQNDLDTIEKALINSDSPAGPALTDAHHLCAS